MNTGPTRDRFVTAAICAFALGCGEPYTTTPAMGTETDGTGTSAGETTAGPGTETSATETETENPGTDSDSDGSTTGPPAMVVHCGDSPPEGAELAPPLPTFGGTCPAIEVGWDPEWSEAGNVVTMPVPDGMPMDRRFAVIAPENIDESEVLPVLFMWHWLGGEAEDFYDRSEVQDAVNVHRFLAVIPESGGDLLFQWPYSAVDTLERKELEFQFFDAMLACVAEQFTIDENCVSSSGVSAGALWTAQLAGGRGQHLSSIISLSGGVGEPVMNWSPSPHKMPAMVLWGGPDDFCVLVNFDKASKDLEQALGSDGHSVMECIHNCEHSTPPFDSGTQTTYDPMWMYFLDHPYWLRDGESWYEDLGVPIEFPEWCSMGVGNATIRDGQCDPSEC